MNKEDFSLELTQAVFRIRELLEQHGMGEWKEHLFLRKPGEKQSYQFVSHPDDLEFGQKVIEIHQNGN